MTNTTSPRLALALLAASIAACGPGQVAEQSAAASAPPVLIACGELACDWILQAGACAQAAAQRNLPGIFSDVIVLDPVPGTTTITVGGATYSLTLAASGTQLDWAATRPVDFVLAQGSLGANAYFYAPPVSSDTALRAFLGRPVLGVNFCVGAGSLGVTKTATASSTRTFAWTVAKTSTTTSLSLAAGATAPAPYSVTLTAAPLDAEWLVTGTVVVTNPTAVAATGVTIADSFGALPVTPACPGFDGTLAPGASVTCTYALPLAAAMDGVNVVTVTTAGGPTGASAAAPVAFGAPTRVVDECVTVSDVPAGALGTACAAESPKTFSYALTVGPYATCGTPDPVFVNTASFAAPSGAAGAAAWAIPVHVTCPSAGCTLTQGYWKTHSREGPAPYDPRWRDLGPLEEDTIFFRSGATWLQVFRTPVRGSAYLALAHQYMAAKLNVLAGADPTALGGALAAAEAFFDATTPATPLTPLQRAKALKLAELLGAFNEGAIGPGHCGTKPGEPPPACSGEEDDDHEREDGKHERAHDRDDVDDRSCGKRDRGCDGTHAEAHPWRGGPHERRD